MSTTGRPGGGAPHLKPGHVRGTQAAAMLGVSSERMYLLIRARQIPGAVLVERGVDRVRTFSSVPLAWVNNQISHRDSALLDGNLAELSRALNAPADLAPPPAETFALTPSAERQLAALSATLVEVLTATRAGIKVHPSTERAVEDLEKTVTGFRGDAAQFRTALHTLRDSVDGLAAVVRAEQDWRTALRQDLDAIRLLLLDRATAPA